MKSIRIFLMLLFLNSSQIICSHLNESDDNVTIDQRLTLLGASQDCIYSDAFSTLSLNGSLEDTSSYNSAIQIIADRKNQVLNITFETNKLLKTDLTKQDFDILSDEDITVTENKLKRQKQGYYALISIAALSGAAATGSFFEFKFLPGIISASSTVAFIASAQIFKTISKVKFGRYIRNLLSQTE